MIPVRQRPKWHIWDVNAPVHKSRSDQKVVCAMVDGAQARATIENVVASLGQILELHDTPDTFLARLGGVDLIVLDISCDPGRACLSQALPSTVSRPVVVMAPIELRTEILEALRQGAFAVTPAPATEEELTFHIGHALTTLAERFHPRKLEYQERIVHIANDFSLVTPVAMSLVETSLPPGDPRKTAVVLGLVEVITNAIEHGNLGITYEEKREALRGSVFYDLAAERAKEFPWKDRIVRIRACVDSKQGVIRFEVHDQGDGFDWRNLPNPTDPNNINARHGRGILMASHSFASMRYNDKGNAVCLELSLDDGSPLEDG
jgi:hypothetical protein